MLHPDAELIDRLGRRVEVARYFEVTPQAITKWRKEGLPRGRRLHLRTIHPDWFQTLERV